MFIFIILTPSIYFAKLGSEVKVIVCKNHLWNEVLNTNITKCYSTFRCFLNFNTYYIIPRNIKWNCKIGCKYDERIWNISDKKPSFYECMISYRNMNKLDFFMLINLKSYFWRILCTNDFKKLGKLYRAWQIVSIGATYLCCKQIPE